MKSILNLLQRAFNKVSPLQLTVDEKLMVRTSDIKPKFTPGQIEENDKRNFWENLPMLSDDPVEQEKLVQMIRSRFPASAIVDPTYNRRKNYEALYYLRNNSKTNWVLQDTKTRLPGDNRTILDKNLRPAVHLA